MKIILNWEWLFEKIILILPKVLLSVYILNVVLGLMMQSPRILAKNDFLEFWGASSLVLVGKPASVYDIPQFYKTLAQIAGQEFHTPWLYPPIFLLLVAPLALLPYHASLAFWLALTLGGYALVIWRLAPHPLVIWLALAFPGALMNLNYGQNGLLSTALFGGGLLLLESHPLIAGMLLGILSYKPNFFVLLPVALIAGRYWRTLGAAMLSTVILIVSSGLLFGWETWIGYWHIRHIPMQILEQGFVNLKLMPTFFAAALMAGGGLTTAYILQGIAMAVSLGAVIWVWSSQASMALKVSVLTLGSLLFTPYSSEYELARLAIPLAWLGWQRYQEGRLASVEIFLAVAWLTPLFSRLLAENHLVQLTPIILLILLYSNLKAVHVLTP
jgi:hypothetical protein